MTETITERCELKGLRMTGQRRTIAAVLEEADLVLAEDTRRAGLLFKRLELGRHGRLMSFFEHNEDKRLPKVMSCLEDGLDVALISDAGTPLLSDPGFTLVRACRDQEIPVRPVPGPSAPVTARRPASVAEGMRAVISSGSDSFVATVIASVANETTNSGVIGSPS